MGHLTFHHTAVYLTKLQLFGPPASTVVLAPDTVVRDLESIKNLIDERIQKSSGHSRYLQEVNRRFAMGDYCLVQKVDNEVVGYLFISEKIAHLAPVRVKRKLLPGEVAIYDVYTREQFRGKGCYPALFESACQWLMARGYTTIWLWVMPHNMVSVKTHLKLGFRHIYTVFHLYQFLGMRLHMARKVLLPLESLLK